jgi:hypothetical protein
LVEEQVNEQVHEGAEGSNVAEFHDALAQCLLAFLLRAARAAPAARHRKAQFGAWIDHGVEVDAEVCNERPELGFCRMPARYRFIAKLIVVCHPVISRIVCKRIFVVPATARGHGRRRPPLNRPAGANASPALRRARSVQLCGHSRRGAANHIVFSARSLHR